MLFDNFHARSSRSSTNYNMSASGCVIVSMICIIGGIIVGACLIYYYNINSYEETTCYTHSLSETYQINKVRWGFTYILSTLGETCGTEYSVSVSLRNIEDARVSYDNKISRCWYSKSDICDTTKYSPSVFFGFGIFLCVFCGLGISYPIYYIYIRITDNKRNKKEESENNNNNNNNNVTVETPTSTDQIETSTSDSGEEV